MRKKRVAQAMKKRVRWNTSTSFSKSNPTLSTFPDQAQNKEPKFLKHNDTALSDEGRSSASSGHQSEYYIDFVLSKIERSEPNSATEDDYD